MKTKLKQQQGISLIETLVGIAILAFVSLSLFALFDLTLRVIWENKARAGAQALANQHMEISRNLPYIDVGTIGGIPSGSIAQVATTTSNGIEYTVATSVIYIDDPFDGTQGGVPDDLLPTDYKRIRVEISWDFRLQTKPIVFLSDIAPEGLESELGGGTIRITALNGLGQVLPQANVHIENSSITPNVFLDIQTNNSGIALLPGATSSVETYEVTVSKTSYSEDKTYGTDPVNLPTPIRPHLTVIEGSVTDVAFSIDVLSSMNVTTVLAGDSCGVVKAPSIYVVDTPGTSVDPVVAYHRSPFLPDEPESGFRIALQDQIYVDGLIGSDTSGDGSSSNPYATLGRALQNIDQGEGDVIHLAGGQTYNEGPFVLDATYSGATSTPTIIQSWLGTATATVATLGSRVFEFKGTKHFVLDHLGLTGATATEAILIDDDTSNITVQNSLITGSSGAGIRLKGGTSHSIIGNTINFNGSYGLQVESSVNTIQSNLIHDHSEAGIFVTGGSNDLIQNTLYNNGHGIEVASSDNLINNNITYQNTQHGIYVYHGSGQNTVSNNVSYSNSINGLLFEGLGTNVISGNESYLNTKHGIQLDSASNTLSVNIVRDNIQDGFYITADDNIFNGDQVNSNNRYGLYAQDVSGIDLQFLDVSFNTLDGVRMDNCSNCHVAGSEIYDNINSGIHILNSNTVIIDGNDIHNNSTRGVYLESSANVTIDHNLIYRQGSHGIDFNGSSNNSITSNTLAQNSVDGIELGSNSIGNTVKNNIVAFNGGQGLDDNDDLSEPDDTYNLFYNNTSGDLNSLTPSAGGTGTATGTDPLFVNLSNDNYHLQSIKGYYPFGGGDVSSQHSSGIDAGDPVSPFTNEPAPNGCALNSGAYGGTLEASKSTEVGDPVSDLDFNIRGSKLKGWDAQSDPVYKFDEATSTDATGSKSIFNLEWDSYLLTVNATSTGYDIAYTDPYQPITLLANTAQNIEIGLVSDSQHSLHLLVLDSLDGTPAENAQVRLYNTGLSYDESKSVPTHGQVFFSDLQIATYTLEITLGGFEFYTASVNISWYTSETINLTPL